LGSGPGGLGVPYTVAATSSGGCPSDQFRRAEHGSGAGFSQFPTESRVSYPSGSGGGVGVAAGLGEDWTTLRPSPAGQDPAPGLEFLLDTAERREEGGCHRPGSMWPCVCTPLLTVQSGRGPKAGSRGTLGAPRRPRGLRGRPDWCASRGGGVLGSVRSAFSLFCPHCRDHCPVTVWLDSGEFVGLGASYKPRHVSICIRLGSHTEAPSCLHLHSQMPPSPMFTFEAKVPSSRLMGVDTVLARRPHFQGKSSWTWSTRSSCLATGR